MNADARGVSLEATDLKKSFDSFTLEVPSLAIDAGTTLAVLGPSGSGKSTLLSTLALLVKPDSGHIRFDGVEVDHRDRRARLMTAALFQRPYLFEGTVQSNVEYGLRLRKVPREERERRVAEALKMVGLSDTSDRSVQTLSGGEAQRVGLARALVLEPRVLFLDEPLSSLDALIKTALADDFARILHAQGVTTVYVTHDQAEAAVVADNIAILRDGRMARHGSVDEVTTLPTDAWVAGFIGMEPPLAGRIVDSQDGVARVECGATSVFAVSELPVGTNVLAAVRPEDVILFGASEQIPASSARNQLRLRVADVRSRGATIRVTVEDADVRIAAVVSRSSARELALSPGGEVVALFKATATRLTARRSDDSTQAQEE